MSTLTNIKPLLKRRIIVDENQEKLNQLQELIIQWAKARRLIPLANPETQMMKNVSEIGELADAIAKKDNAGIKDAIGDIFVILVIWNQLKWNHDMSEFQPIVMPVGNINEFFTEFLYSFTDIFRGSINGHKSNVFYFLSVIDYLASFAEYFNMTLVECVESAYNEIKDRKGYLTPEGVFIKEQ